VKIRLSISTYFTVYFLLLLLIYHFKIKHYFYWNYIAILKGSEFDFSLGRLAVAGVLFIFNLYILSRINKQALLYTVMAVFFALLTVPSLVAFTSKGMNPISLIFYHQLFFVLLYGVGRIRMDVSKIPVLRKHQALYALFILTTLGIIPYLIVYGPYINLKNLALIEVYETRRAILEFSNPYFGYTYSAFTKIILPLLIIFSLELKNKLILIISILYLILFYLFGAHKTVYLGLIVIFLFYWTTYFRAAYLLIKYSIVLIVIAMILALFDFDYLWILTIRRVHFIPTLLDICYVDFFEGQPLLWSESVLSNIVLYPFDVSHTNLIGSNYFNNPSMAANNGLISDGYMNWGGWGVLVNTILASVYFVLLNNLYIPSKYFGLFFLIIFSFISSSFTTVFFTHGAILLLIISLFLLREKQ